MRLTLPTLLPILLLPTAAQAGIIALTLSTEVDDYHTLEPTVFIQVEGVEGTRIERTLPGVPLCIGLENQNCRVDFQGPEADGLIAEITKPGDSLLRWGYGEHSRQIWESTFVIPGLLRSVEDFHGHDVGRIRWDVYAADHVPGFSRMYFSWQAWQAPEPAALALLLPALAWPGRRR